MIGRAAALVLSAGPLLFGPASVNRARPVTFD